MKRTFMALILSCMAIFAHAENWVLVQDADNGARLLVDISSYREIKGDNNSVVAAAFRYVVNGDPHEPMYYVVEATSCKTMSGGLYARNYENGRWVTVNKYWWSADGSKMYDAIGELLCDAFNKRATGGGGNKQLGVSNGSV